MSNEIPESGHNVATLLAAAAAKDPERLAVAAPHRPDVLGRAQLSFADLDASSSKLAAAMLERGFMPGARVLVMVKPGVDFITLVFALFKAGLVPVMVDPGMGLRRMLRCLSEGRPEGVVGLSIAHLISLFLPHYFRAVKLRVTIGRRLGWGGPTLTELMEGPEPSYGADKTPVPVRPDDTAAILFTSGATGPAKGVTYTHAMFRAQIEAIANGLDMRPGGVDLATFPLFALFSPALGLSAVIPNMNPSKPGKVDPRRILEPVNEFGVTSMFASPSLLIRVSRYAHEHGLALPTLKRVISAGAPVAPRVLAAVKPLLSADAKLMTPYGATEGVPLSSIEADEILGDTRVMTEQGLGNCVGRPVEGVELRVIKISEYVIKKFSPDLLVPIGEIGEIIAKGPMVSPTYFERPDETAMTIMPDPEGGFWRRMGDVGWLDQKGRLWFCGRKRHRVTTAQGTLFTIPCEAVFNNHPRVRRSALVGVGPAGRQKPALVVELNYRFRGPKWEQVVEELQALARTNPRSINIATFLRHPSLPVDIRHNAKIDRERLARWAAAELSKKNNHNGGK